MRILLVEDDATLGDGIVQGLATLDFRVHWVRTAELALTSLDAFEHAAVVLDISLPGLSGLDLLRLRRQAGDETPVLLLTARDTVRDRVTGLDAGADDYLVKPFDLDELAARLRALIRRRSSRRHPGLVLHDVQLDVAAHRCLYEGREVELSRREFAVLRVLFEHAGTVLSRGRIEQALYDWDGEVESNTIEVHVHHLRRKLGNALIRTVRGIGYTIDLDADGATSP